MLYTVTLAFDNVDAPYKADVVARTPIQALRLVEQDARSTVQGKGYGELVASIVTELG